MKNVFVLRSFLLLSVCTATFSLSPAAFAQLSEPPSVAEGAVTQKQNAQASANRTTSPTGDEAVQLQEYLTAHPEVASELKDLLVQRLADQGSAIDADSITDQMLFARLQSDVRFRAEALRLMVNRGYLTEQQAQQFSAPVRREPGEQEETLPTQLQTPAVPPSSVPEMPVSPTEATVSKVQGSSREAATAPRIDTSRPQTPQNTIGEPAPLFPSTVRRKNPYPTLPSTTDLYKQYVSDTKPLKRFGADIFRPDVVGLSTFPMDLPAGADYVLGPGDTLAVDIWGGVSQRFTRVVDREGRVSLPDAGPATVAGLTLAEAQKRIQNLLSPQYRDAKVDVSVTRLRTVRVYVVGDVQRPGAYDISSLSTPLNALYVAGGPTAAGSLRIVRHYRGAQLISEQDLYELLIFGVRKSIENLQSGDTILVPPVGPQVGISGAVRRPAIYELANKNDPLANLVDYAGGITVSGSLEDIKVERVIAHDKRVTVDVQVPHGADSAALKAALNAYQLQDGDRVYVLSINPYKQETVYLEGHVYRPGSYPYREGMTVKDIIQSYQDLLPEPSSHGEIVRLVAPDFRPQNIPFDVHDALTGSDTVKLQQFDTVRIFGRYEIDAPRVAIYGQVLRPGEYPMTAGMTAAGLVRMAGGFTRSAYVQSASLASYVVENGDRAVTDQKTLNIGAAVAGSEQQDITLKPGDVLTILQIPGWSDIGRSVTIKGEVMYPGSYGINEGERLSTFLRRVGGFRDTAYPAGAVLERDDVRKMEEQGRQELIQRIESTSASVRISPNTTGQDQAAVMQAVQQQQTQAIARLRSQPVPGRLVISISGDIAEWENTSNDVILRAGDVITIPKKPNFVIAYGQVYNANAITYRPGKTAGWYLKQSGGPTQLANKKGIYVIRANGSVVSHGGSADMFTGGVLSTKLQPGDVIVVPEKFVTGSSTWKTTLETAQFLASLAIAAAAVAQL